MHQRLGDQGKFDKLRSLVATRNIIVHDRGVVNEMFIASVKGASIGEQVEVGLKEASAAIGIVGATAIDLDERLTRKFTGSTNLR